MNTPALAVVEITYLVKVSSPVYDPITDGYIRQRVTIEEAFSTYYEALQYIAENYNSHELQDAATCCRLQNSPYDPFAYIAVDVTYEDKAGHYYVREFHLHQLTGRSQYYGPVDDNTPF